jgi:hypothetical protein
MALIIVLPVMAGCGGGSGDITGKYVLSDPNSPLSGDYIVLEEEGKLSYHSSSSGEDISGSWEVSGNEIQFVLKGFGEYIYGTFRIAGNALIDKEGGRWVKISDKEP